MTRILKWTLGLLIATTVLASCATSYSACAAYAEVESCE